MREIQIYELGAPPPDFNDGDVMGYVVYLYMWEGLVRTGSVKWSHSLVQNGTPMSNEMDLVKSGRLVYLGWSPGNSRSPRAEHLMNINTPIAATKAIQQSKPTKRNIRVEDIEDDDDIGKD